MERSDRLIELLEILKRAECIFIEQWKILYKEDEVDMGDIFNGNYIPVYTSLPITITNNHKLYKYYIC